MYEVIQTYFGEPCNETKFKLPDARGRVLGAVNCSHSIGSTDGSEDVGFTLSTMQVQSGSNATVASPGTYNLSVMQPTLFGGNLFIYGGGSGTPVEIV